MLIFGNDKHARGCYIEVMKKKTLGAGAYLTLPGGAGVLPTAGPIDGYFISNISFAQKEKFHVVQCFNERNYVYAFGHDPMDSLVEVVFTTFLVDSSGKSFGKAVKTLMAAYGKARISQAPQQATLTLGSLSVSGFVVGMRSATEDAEHNLQSFSVTLLLVEAQNG